MGMPHVSFVTRMKAYLTCSLTVLQQSMFGVLWQKLWEQLTDLAVSLNFFGGFPTWSLLVEMFR
jgi:hypothetical protein